jgi:hypothetical protein
VAAIRAAIDECGFNNPILLKDDATTVGAGHGRLLAALLDPPLARVPTITLPGLTEAQWRAYVIADNRLAEGATWDLETLRLEVAELTLAGFDLSIAGFDAADLKALAEPTKGAAGGAGRLAERFGIPPFSVLNAREGWWQDRKAAWVSLGIQSELGRGQERLDMAHPATTSTIDFYALKRGLEAELGRDLTTPKARAILAERGELKDDRADNAAAKNERAASFKSQDRLRALQETGSSTLGAVPRNQASILKRGGGYAKAESMAGAPGRMDGYDHKRRADARSFGEDLMRGERTYLPAGATFGQMANFDGAERTITGTSIFDPVLCELAYRWFSPPGASVLDPFAGGSVRGVVAGKLGRAYVGVDLSERQVAANWEQAHAIFGRDLTTADGAWKPHWAVGDSLALADLVEPEVKFDFVFSCPPYADLEVYSEDPRDLSTMAYADFVAAYRKIIALACARLRDDRFACFVVGDVRDPAGAYRSFPQATIEAFTAAGLALYNDAILVTAVGSLPIRAGRQFAAGRKLGTTHQRILVFLKGDAKRAVEALGEVEFGAITGDVAADAGEPTPCQLIADNVWLKRDDLFSFAGVSGGKVRGCAHIVASAGSEVRGLVTAGSRASPQVNIVAHIGREFGLPVRVHVPSGALGAEVEAAKAAGAEVVQHKPGYNSVIVARARDDAADRGWLEVPFGMECDAAAGADLTLATAQGVLFECPRRRAPEGSHSILAWFRGRGVPDDALDACPRCARHLRARAPGANHPAPPFLKPSQAVSS